MFKDLHLKSVYDTSKDNIIEDLFCPLLANSVRYQRGVGYFTSGWLRLAASGLIQLAKNAGNAQIITSPILQENDWEAFIRGNEARQDEILFNTLKSEVSNLESTLERDTLTALAWLIADGLLNIKFAIPKNRLGDFHDKFAVFHDIEGNRIAIHGSYNDSIHGTLNGESFSVFRSWTSGQLEYVETHQKRFELLHEGKNDFFKMFDLPDAIKESIVRLNKGLPRPYIVKTNHMKKTVKLPKEIHLYDFQNEAIENWFAKQKMGLFEMATGTGKTITSLALSVMLSNSLNDRLMIVITVPFGHLVEQWREDVIAFGFSPLSCQGSYQQWYSKVRSRIQDYNIRARNSLVLISTHDTSSSARFTKLISKVQGDILFIADEVHYLGAPKLRKAMLPEYNYRVGLSATPDRWFDEAGTGLIYEYFKEKVIEYPLDKAIENGFLTPYRFFPHPVDLTYEEIQEYSRLTTIIRNILQNTDDAQDNEQLKSLLRKRAKLVATAVNKLAALESLLRQQMKEEGVQGVSHTIIYCASGETNKALSITNRLGLKAREFIYTVPINQRAKILKQFEEGDLQVLVAIKCLDEGVNIPITKRAYFLASTTNPREFVQRRGRILRKHPQKTEALLYDFIVVPPLQNGVMDGEHAKSLLRKEMPRFAEFASSAKNEFEARDVLVPILSRYDMLALFDKKPWDVYRENIKTIGEEDEDECAKQAR